tara:strand:+ start:1593 stop:2057 length:465 start_codon:yes stop_codon:yes gene_type:complete
MYTLGYIGLIVLVNWGFSVTPLIPLPTGDMFPPMSIVVGLVFVARDYAQKEVGHKVIFAMLIAAGLSYWMASPFIAFASLAAFLVSEFADWGVYTWIKKPFAQRILISSAMSTPLDSAVFLAMIGHFSVSGVIIMTLSKMIGALVVWQIVRRKA